MADTPTTAPNHDDAELRALADDLIRTARIGFWPWKPLPADEANRVVRMLAESGHDLIGDDPDVLDAELQAIALVAAALDGRRDDADRLAPTTISEAQALTLALAMIAAQALAATGGPRHALDMIRDGLIRKHAADGRTTE